MIPWLVKLLFGNVIPLPGFDHTWILRGLGHNACILGTHIFVGEHLVSGPREILLAVLAHENAHDLLHHTSYFYRLVHRLSRDECEFQADAWAARHGFGPGLLEYLRMYSYHPSHVLTRERIRRLEALCVNV